MALALYRRHRRGCKAGHVEETRSSEYDERKKGWKRCECPIFVSGSLHKRFSRQTTGQWEWDVARAVAERLEAVGTWGNVGPTLHPATETAPSRTTIADATEAFLAKCQNRAIQLTTMAKYKTFTNQLTGFCGDRGCGYIDQLTISDIDRFYASWKDGIRGKTKKLERLKAFVKFCMKRKWLKEDVASDIEPPAGSSLINPKAPFTDEEINRIYAACDNMEQGRRNWTGRDAKDFIDLSLYTGLRISDVATFDVSKRLHGNDVFLRMHKTRQPISTWIPDWLVERLRAREAENGSLIFACGVTQNAKQLCDIWRNKRLKYIFTLSGPWEEPAHPHRFRHTFVRILLENGVPLPDVAELVGDTEAVVRKHYSRFVKTRQNRLSKILQDAFADKAKPRLVAIR
jgi:site-specific recombinase XerD